MLKLAILGAALLCTTAANAANFSMENNDSTIVVDGNILDGDGKKFIDFVLQHQDADYVRLNSLGGAVRDGMIMAQTIREFKFDTWVDGSDTCMSMCSLMFAAGVGRWHSAGAVIGVHSMRWDPSIVGKDHVSEDQETMAITMWIARMASDFGMPPSVVGKMIETPGDRMAYLTSDDLELFSTLVDNSATKQYTERMNMN